MGGDPQHIKNQLDLEWSKAISIWNDARRYGTRTVSAFFIATWFLFIIHKEYERIEPTSKVRHQKNAVRDYCLFKYYWEKEKIAQKSVDSKIHNDRYNNIALNWHTKSEWQGEYLVTYYEHYFDWQGKRYEAEWQTDMLLSPGAGENLHYDVVLATSKPFVEQIEKLSGCWDDYYQKMIKELQANSSPDEWKKFQAEIEEAYKEGKVGIMFDATSIGQPSRSPSSIGEMIFETLPSQQPSWGCNREHPKFLDAA